MHSFIHLEKLSGTSPFNQKKKKISAFKKVNVSKIVPTKNFIGVIKHLMARLHISSHLSYVGMLQELAWAEIAYKKRDLQLRLEKKLSHPHTYHIYDYEVDRNNAVNPQSNKTSLKISIVKLSNSFHTALSFKKKKLTGMLVSFCPCLQNS